MKLKLTAMLVAVAFFLQACTSTYDLTSTPQENHPWLEKQYQTYHDFLAEAQGKTVRIVLTSGQEILGTVTRADADSVGWIGGKDVTTEDLGGWMKPAQADSLRGTDSTAISARVVPTSRVLSLEISHNYAWPVAIGAFAVTMVPVVAGWNGDTDHISGVPDYSSRNQAIVLAIGGTGLCALIGSAIHHTDQYLTTGTGGSADTTLPRSRN